MGLVVQGRKTPQEFFSPELYKIQGFDSIGVPLDVVLLTAPLGLMFLQLNRTFPTVHTFPRVARLSIGGSLPARLRGGGVLIGCYFECMKSDF